MALNQRRRAMGEAAELEREREAALLEQLEEMFAELEGPALDEEVLARIAPADADIVRTALRGYDASEESPEDEPDEDWLADAENDPATERQELLAEIARLEEEIARSRRRRDAFERYVDALDG